MNIATHSHIRLLQKEGNSNVTFIDISYLIDDRAKSFSGVS